MMKTIVNNTLFKQVSHCIFVHNASSINLIILNASIKVEAVFIFL